MSNLLYNNLWREAQEELRRTLGQDGKIRKKGPIKNDNDAKWLVCHLYVDYVRVVNKLDACYDQILHPQKRELLSRLLDTALGRLLELRRDLLRIELDDYSYFDDILMELKLCHEDLEVKPPKAFWRDRQRDMAERRKWIKRAFEEMKLEEYKVEYLKNVPEGERQQVWDDYLKVRAAEMLEKERQEEMLRRRPGYVPPPPPPEEIPPHLMELSEAVRTIQRHERARQGRAHVPQAKFNKKLKKTGLKPKKVPQDVAHKATVVIQRHWRRHWKRVLAARKDEREMLLLGMLRFSWNDSARYNKVREVEKTRRELQDRNQKEYEQALVSGKERVVKLHGAAMAEDIADEIRNWFQWFFLQSDFLPDFPPPDPLVPTGEMMGWPKGITKEFVEKNFPQPKRKMAEATPVALALAGINTLEGSALVVADQWIGPTQFLICQKELERLKKNKTKGEKPKKLSKAELAELKKKEMEKEKRRLEAEEALGFQMRDSNFVAPLYKADKDYRVTWMDKDESHNFEQRFDNQLVNDDKCYEVSLEVRRTVDELMRMELELLKDALERDKNPKKKPKKAKPKKTKEKKGKKKKDPTGDRTLEELFIELFNNGIIKDFDEAHLSDYLGERSFNAFEYRARGENPLPCSGDVRELLLQMCILPLGSSRVHQLSPVLRSVCLMGPENSGKEFLARIVCTETASVMFDLTPGNLVGKYPGKTGLKMLQHLVEKMSRALQPSVIFVDGAEKPFYKKVPKPEKQTDPKRLKGVFPKLVKGIKAEDQVLVLGVCSYPWLCPAGKLMKTYDKFLFVPPPDYGTYFMLWQNLLTPYHSIPRQLDFSSLAKVSKGYSVKVIMDLVKEVMTAERIGRSRVRQIRTQDFMELLCKIEPIPNQNQEKILKFLSKTPLALKKEQRQEQIKLLKAKGK